MTPEQQRKADHLALVAAPIYAQLLVGSAFRQMSAESLMDMVLNEASMLQKAAEERAKTHE